VAGIIGWRYKISKKSLIEMDYRFSQKEISLKGDPKKLTNSQARQLDCYSVILYLIPKIRIEHYGQKRFPD